MAKTWFITGTSSGFGQALAKIIAQHEDVNLIAAARNLADLAYLNDYDQTAIEKVVMDVTNKDQIAEAVKQGQARFGGDRCVSEQRRVGLFWDG
ncbi:SDR family NAD(P)-dependent oxidoreductase [Secundilactobacillus paracollinoides]|uniref:SDR family NAD(P)-dependent oxidoreductase n=1 Tax=Secundilactobacillus paracollinoides TaxID=240427 RepID=UPI002987FDAC|nr:SDR family NAD(P)-dependent oxidoreductase [Secundilactobacillus paracollinoides]